ncbi:hypothetical protein P3T36_006806 [Kitasatospora sp. MAP12-15]|nr:hypothetical protein [Kitasatospora sp. MAP12-44]
MTGSAHGPEGPGPCDGAAEKEKQKEKRMRDWYAPRVMLGGRSKPQCWVVSALGSSTTGC